MTPSGPPRGFTSHTQAAEKIAATAYQLLTEVMAESNKPPNPHISGPDHDLEELARWAKVRALQAQAQIHATLSVKDHLPSDSF